MKQDQLLVVYGEDPGQMTARLLEHIDLFRLLPEDAVIGLKPNLVKAVPADSGATTHPEIVEAVICRLREQGYKNLLIMESSWVGANTRRAFRECGYERIARKYHVPLVDLKNDPPATVKAGKMELKICRQALKADFLINFPVLKAHCQTALTCALKNLKGCIPDSEKRRYHGLGLHRPIAALSSVLRPHLTIVDAVCGDLSFEEGGNPVPMGRLIAGTDPVLIDAYACALLGLELSAVPYINMAARLGAGTADLSQAQIMEINPENKPAFSFHLTGRAQTLAKIVEERQACSACFGSLLHALHRLNEEQGRKRFSGNKIKIGQGFRGKNGRGPGIGNCTRGLDSYLPGCPPTAREIKKFLQK